MFYYADHLYSGHLGDQWGFKGMGVQPDTNRLELILHASIQVCYCLPVNC